MKKLIAVLAGSFLFIGNTALAKSAKLHWVTKCPIEETMVTLSFESESGEIDEDDQIVTLIIDDKKIKLGLEPLLYEPIPLPAGEVSACDKLAGLVVEEKYLLIMFGQNNKPKLSKLGAIVVDLQKKKLADTNEDLGTMKKFDYKVLDNGFHVHLNQGTKIGGTKADADFYKNGWKKITVKNGKIAEAWDKPLAAGYKAE
ncbi:MAG: hypothetical protein V4736_02570 [Bdellovibrionota bacterium]